MVISPPVIGWKNWLLAVVDSEGVGWAALGIAAEYIAFRHRFQDLDIEGPVGDRALPQHGPPGTTSPHGIGSVSTIRRDNGSKRSVAFRAADSESCPTAAQAPQGASAMVRG